MSYKMTPKQFKEIRQLRGISQGALAKHLKASTNIGSRDLVARMEAGTSPVQPYIEKTMNSFKLFGLPIEGQKLKQEEEEKSCESMGKGSLQAAVIDAIEDNHTSNEDLRMLLSDCLEFL